VRERRHQPLRLRFARRIGHHGGHLVLRERRRHRQQRRELQRRRGRRQQQQQHERHRDQQLRRHDFEQHGRHQHQLDLEHVQRLHVEHLQHLHVEHLQLQRHRLPQQRRVVLELERLLPEQLQQRGDVRPVRVRRDRGGVRIRAAGVLLGELQLQHVPGLPGGRVPVLRRRVVLLEPVQQWPLRVHAERELRLLPGLPVLLQQVLEQPLSVATARGRRGGTMRPETGSVSQASWAERTFEAGSEITDETDGAVYVVGCFLGRGGMGEVHEVTRRDTGARYALKCLLLQHAHKTKTIERTRREALTLREIRHPNVVRVHASGVLDEGLIWMVMDLLEGHTLAAVMRQLGRLPLPWALSVGRAAAEGLAAVHAHAVHRDVKPANLHLGNDATVRVLDLGAGKFHRSVMLTTADRTLGTVPYMSPEQLTSRAPVDGRSDVFSLATVLVESISGVHPFAPGGFANENVFTVVQRILSGPHASLAALAPWVPPFVAATIDQALARAPDARPASASAFAAALAADLDRLERQVGASEPLSTLVQHLNSASAPADPEPRTVELPTLEKPTREVPGHPAESHSVTSESDTSVMVRASDPGNRRT
jgi:serine/threonine protein kinase